MHPSYFLISTDDQVHSKNELSVSSETSEWLFYEQFWERFNQRHQTFFGQYEEEILSRHLIPAMIDSLQVSIEELNGKLVPEISFRYGWNANNQALICTVSNAVLAEEISMLIALLKKAATLEADVYCQL